MSMEDREKVQLKLKELNTGLNHPQWDESLGFVVMPAISFQDDTKSYGIQMGSGIAVKLFINTETGETRVFWADKFMKDIAS